MRPELLAWGFTPDQLQRLSQWIGLPIKDAISADFTRERMLSGTHFIINAEHALEFGGIVSGIEFDPAQEEATVWCDHSILLIPREFTDPTDLEEIREFWLDMDESLNLPDMLCDEMDTHDRETTIGFCHCVHFLCWRKRIHPESPRTGFDYRLQQEQEEGDKTYARDAELDRAYERERRAQERHAQRSLYEDAEEDETPDEAPFGRDHPYYYFPLTPGEVKHLEGCVSCRAKVFELTQGLPAYKRLDQTLYPDA